MATPDEGCRGYARQARADFDAWKFLQGSKVPECQKLHLLQMACEKLTKAHLCLAGSNPQDLRSSHAYIHKNLPIVMRHQLSLEYKPPKVIKDLVHSTKRLAREIELLSPAVDDAGKRPDNCEYPWEDNKQQLQIPADWQFFGLNLLFVPRGRTMLKMIERAVERLSGQPSEGAK